MLALLLISGSLLTNESAVTRVHYANRVDHGYIFLNGEYLKPPYTLVESDQALAINGQVTYAELPAIVGWHEIDTHGGFLETKLNAEAVVFLDDDEPIRVIERGAETGRLLNALLSSELAFRDDVLEKHSDLQSQAKWLRQFDPPRHFVLRANKHLALLRDNRATTVSRISAVQRSANLAYPMTILGMLAGVWALGHLLGSSPRPDDDVSAYASDPILVRSTSLSILGVVILSALDLVWTLLAGHTNQMRELNPLGSGLIQNPLALVGFKTLATLLGCGLLFALRHNHRVRRAAWWMCLVMTVLTFRWLVFNSMNFAG